MSKYSSSTRTAFMIRSINGNGIGKRSYSVRRVPRSFQTTYTFSHICIPTSSATQGSNVYPFILQQRLLSTSTGKERSDSSSSIPPSPSRKTKLELRPGPVKLSSATKTNDLSPGKSPTAQGSDLESLPPSAKNSSQVPRGNNNEESITEVTKHDMADAAAHGILAPPPPNASWAGRLWHQAKELFKFYLRGVKMVNTHRKQTQAIHQRIKSGGSPLTRREMRFIRTYHDDVMKLVPFLILVLVLEEVIPLLALYAPGMLPSTCILPNQRARIESRRAATQLVVYDSLRPMLAELAMLPPSHVLRSLNGQDPTWALCGLLQLPTWGIASLRVRRIKRHLKMIAEDDALLRKDGLDILSYREVVDALHERGIITRNLAPQVLPSLLQRWLDAVDVTTEGDVTQRRVSMVLRSMSQT